MNTFKVGDKVICINSDNASKLIIGNRYTIKGVSGLFIKLEELDSGIIDSYFSYRVVLAEQPKDEATEIQDKINELSTQLESILKKKENIQLEQNYHDTLVKMRSAVCAGTM